MEKLIGGVFATYTVDPYYALNEAVYRATERCDGRFPVEIRVSLRNWLYAYEAMAAKNCPACYHRTRDLRIVNVPIKADPEAGEGVMRVLCADGSVLEAIIA